jgi:chemotaxis protein methyltransferase CheR
MEKTETKDRKPEDGYYSFSTPKLTDEQFEHLRFFIEGELGIKMPPAKKVMLESRLQKRVRSLRYADFTAYLEYVFSDEGRKTELIHMIDTVTTNKTDFFREPDHFEYLLGTLLPERYNKSGWGRREALRVWSTASSSGEEPYTLAMVMQEFADKADDFDYQILGTDISMRVLEMAVNAVYTEERTAPVPAAYKKKYLLRSKDHSKKLVRVKPSLRQKVVYRRMNLMAPDLSIKTLFHIVFCRNVIIYFDKSNQAKLLKKIYDQLLPGGYLFLGHSETLTGVNLPFYSVAPTVYRKPE